MHTVGGENPPGEPPLSRRKKRITLPEKPPGETPWQGFLRFLLQNGEKTLAGFFLRFIVL